MVKYIDADLLLKEIENYRTECEDSYGEPGDNNFPFGKVTACNKIIDIIDSLQQKPPEVDLEKEIKDWCDENITGVQSIYTANSLICYLLPRTARHFYELGQKDAANKYDEIEYNRQRADEETLC